jgi:hypothetical protein
MEEKINFKNNIKKWWIKWAKRQENI